MKFFFDKNSTCWKWNILFEVTDFTYPEVRKTRMGLLPEFDSDYLFVSNGDELNKMKDVI